MASSSAARRGEHVRRAATGTGATLALVAISVSTSGAAHADSTYTVRSGDTVSHIAARTGSTVAAIARASALQDPGRIHVGQVLTIPTKGATTAPAGPSRTAAVTTTSDVRYTVRAGDTVSGIAARTGSSVAAIIAHNALRADGLIFAGQTLTIPGKATATASRSSAAPRTGATTISHTVRPGDTVSGIAARYGSSVSTIVATNHLGANALVRIGQTLQVPTVGASSGAAATPERTPAPALVGSTFEGRTYARDVVDAANANKRTLLEVGVPSKQEMQAKVVATARQLGVDPALAQAIAFQESGFNHTAVSPANAIGTMQVIPSSGDWAGTLLGRRLNLLDPDDNVAAGVVILKSLVATSSDLASAIAGYYQGAASVRKYGMFADTRRYVANVQTHMARFR